MGKSTPAPWRHVQDGEKSPAGARMDKAARLLSLAEDLLAPAGLSLHDIQARCGVGRRTAERLRDAVGRAFPLETVPGEGRTLRWRVRDAARIGRLARLDAEDLAAVRAAAARFRAEGLVPQAERLHDLEARLRAFVRGNVLDSISPDLEALSAAEGLAMRPGPRADIQPGILSALYSAIRRREEVVLHYHARGTGARSRQRVRPYGLLYGHRHYLVAFSVNERVQDVRTFALPNIELVEPSGALFTPDPNFDLRRYAQQSFGVFQERAYNIVWRFKPEAAAEARTWLFHPSQTLIERPDGSLEVRFRAGGLLEMCWHLFTWGADVEVVAPRVLANRYKKLLDAARAAQQP